MMEGVSLGDVVRVTKGRYFGAEADLSRKITDVVKDNRDVTPGALFAAFRGAKIRRAQLNPRSVGRRRCLQHSEKRTLTNVPISR